MRPAARRVHHHLFHVGLLHTLKKALEMAFAVPIRIALVDHTPFSQLIWEVAPSGTRAGHPEQGIETPFTRLRGGPCRVAAVAQYAAIAHR